MAGMPTGPVRVLMVAIGGYGFYYLKTLLEECDPTRARVVGIVDPEAERSAAWPTVAGLGVPVCANVEEYYAAGHEADLAVIASPIHHHVPQSLVALAGGSNVLCDKPLGATIQEAEHLIAARNAARRWVMIGYQWSFSAAILALKHDISAGLFGRPKRCATMCCWPRDAQYYQRNNWAGRLHDRATGRWVLDSPANNAMAHFLHNLFFVLGSAPHLSARPREVQAEVYRAYPLESCDTVACRAITDEDTEVLFLVSHATRTRLEPRFRLEFEDAVVTFGEDAPTVVATDRTGRRKDYGSPEDTPQFRKLFAAIDGALHEAPIACGPEAALSQTLAVNGIHESMPDACEFPAGMVRHEIGPERLAVDGLAETLSRCYREALLPSETGASWAVAGRRVSLAGYRWYPGGAGSGGVSAGETGSGEVSAGAPGDTPTAGPARARRTP